MTVKQPEKKLILSDKTSLFADYNWYYSNFYLETKKAIEEFFQKEFNVRFMGIAGHLCPWESPSKGEIATPV